MASQPGGWIGEVDGTSIPGQGWAGKRTYKSQMGWERSGGEKGCCLGGVVIFWGVGLGGETERDEPASFREEESASMALPCYLFSGN